jgi:hypothetical protein
MWGPLVSLTVRTSAPRPRRRCPIRGHCHYLSLMVPSPHRFHSITSGGYKGSTPRWSTPPLFLLHRFTTPVPLRTPSCSPLLSHRGQPTPAPLRPSRSHPKHCTAEYFLPNRSDPVGDPYSGLPSSFRCHRSPLL